MPTPVDILIRVLGAKAAAAQVQEVAAAQQQLAGGAAAAAPAASAAAEALQREAVAAQGAAAALNHTAAAERELVNAEVKGAAAHAASTAAIQRETAALNTLRTSATAANAAVAGAGAGRGFAGGGAGLRATAIYTLSDLISTSSYGFDPTRFLLQQGPQVAQAALLGSSLPMGTVAAYGAGFAVAAAPLIYALNQLGQIIKTRGDALALVTGTNRANTDTIGRMVEQRRAAGKLTDDEAARLQGELRTNSNAQVVKPASPFMAGVRGALNSGVMGAGFGAAYAAQLAANEQAALSIEQRNMEILRSMEAQTTASLAARHAEEMSFLGLAANEKRLALERDLGAERERLEAVLTRETASLGARKQAISAFFEFYHKTQGELLQVDLAQVDAALELARTEKERTLDLDRKAQLQVEINGLLVERARIEEGNYQLSLRAHREEEELKRREPLGFADSLDRQWNDYYRVVSDTAANLADTLMSPIRGFNDGLAQSLDELIAKGGSAGDFFRGIAGSIGDAMRRSFVQMAADWVTTHVLMKGVSLAWAGFLSLMRTKDVVEANSKEAAKMPALAANATLASVGSWGVAVAIGVAAIAGILASMSAFAEGGVVRGPGGPKSDSIMVRVSDREGILNAAAMNRLGEANLNYLNAGGDPAGLRPGLGGGAAGASQAGPTVVRNDIKMAGIYDSEAAALKALEGERGQVFLMNFLTGNVHRVTGKG